jgi:hypothetical protein
MATFYSELYAETATPQVVDVHKRVEAGIAHASMRYARAGVTLDAVLGVGETIRFKQFRSSDRINIVLFSCIDAGTGGTIDAGLYRSGVNHDGAVIDSDLIMDGIACTALAGHGQLYALDNGNNDVGFLDRGKSLWEWVNLATPGTYAADPMEDWDFTLTATVATTVANWNAVFEFYYTTDLGD